MDDPEFRQRCRNPRAIREPFPVQVFPGPPLPLVYETQPRPRALQVAARPPAVLGCAASRRRMTYSEGVEMRFHLAVAASALLAVGALAQAPQGGGRGGRGGGGQAPGA